jgi:hypothetical protein
MYWWSADMLTGRYKNEFRLAWWKETHGAPLGNSYKEGITLFLTDSGGYVNLDYIKLNGRTRVTGRLDIGTDDTLAIEDAGSYRRIQSFNSSPLSINPLGNNVGIGITNPTEKLTVNGNSLTYGSLGTYSSGAGTGAISAENVGTGESYAVMYLKNNNSASGCYWFLNSTTRTADGGANTATFRNDAGSLRLQSSSGTGIMINGTNGNVGIGTTNPLCSLYNYASGTSGWKGQSYFGNENTGVIAGCLDNKAVVGGHNGALNAWTDLYLAPAGNVIIGGNITANSLPLTTQSPMSSNFIRLPLRDTNTGMIRYGSLSWYPISYNNSIAWGGGVNFVTAFNKPHAVSAVRITVTCSLYVTGVANGGANLYITPAGLPGTVLQTISAQKFFNVTFSHEQVSATRIFSGLDLGNYTGNFDILISAFGSGATTDSNDTLWMDAFVFG